uniref:Uncharacterized protein n=1 Tax=Tetraselmis sp. GSL018 TaxID=582737 RepID=A0A061SD44_9CHLO
MASPVEADTTVGAEEEGCDEGEGDTGSLGQYSSNKSGGSLGSSGAQAAPPAEAPAESSEGLPRHESQAERTVELQREDETSNRDLELCKQKLSDAEALISSLQERQREADEAAAAQKRALDEEQQKSKALGRELEETKEASASLQKRLADRVAKAEGDLRTREARVAELEQRTKGLQARSNMADALQRQVQDLRRQLKEADERSERDYAYSSAVRHSARILPEKETAAWRAAPPSQVRSQSVVAAAARDGQQSGGPGPSEQPEPEALDKTALEGFLAAAEAAAGEQEAKMISMVDALSRRVLSARSMLDLHSEAVRNAISTREQMVQEAKELTARLNNSEARGRDVQAHVESLRSRVASLEHEVRVVREDRAAAMAELQIWQAEAERLRQAAARNERAARELQRLEGAPGGDADGFLQRHFSPTRAWAVESPGQAGSSGPETEGRSEARSATAKAWLQTTPSKGLGKPVRPMSAAVGARPGERSDRKLLPSPPPSTASLKSSTKPSTVRRWLSHQPRPESAPHLTGGGRPSPRAPPWRPQQLSTDGMSQSDQGSPPASPSSPPTRSQSPLGPHRAAAETEAETRAGSPPVVVHHHHHHHHHHAVRTCRLPSRSRSHGGKTPRAVEVEVAQAAEETGISPSAGKQVGPWDDLDLQQERRSGCRRGCHCPACERAEAEVYSYEKQAARLDKPYSFLRRHRSGPGHHKSPR